MRSVSRSPLSARPALGSALMLTSMSFVSHAEGLGEARQPPHTGRQIVLHRLTAVHAQKCCTQRRDRQGGLPTPSIHSTGVLIVSRQTPRPACSTRTRMTPTARQGAGAAERLGRGEAISRKADGVSPRSCPGLPSVQPAPIRANPVREQATATQTAKHTRAWTQLATRYPGQETRNEKQPPNILVGTVSQPSLRKLLRSSFVQCFCR